MIFILSSMYFAADFFVYIVVCLQLMLFYRNPLKQPTPKQVDGSTHNFYESQFWIDYIKVSLLINHHCLQFEVNTTCKSMCIVVYVRVYAFYPCRYLCFSTHFGSVCSSFSSPLRTESVSLESFTCLWDSTFSTKDSKC